MLIFFIQYEEDIGFAMNNHLHLEKAEKRKSLSATLISGLRPELILH